jgi:hypothetical protein
MSELSTIGLQLAKHLVTQAEIDYLLFNVLGYPRSMPPWHRILGEYIIVIDDCEREIEPHIWRLDDVAMLPGSDITRLEAMEERIPIEWMHLTMQWDDSFE